MVNPFDLRTVLLAKHAQHVVLIHFPIALFIAGVGLALLSRGKRDSQFASVAYLDLSIAAATVIPAVLTGLLAWRFALEGKKHQRSLAIPCRCSIHCCGSGNRVLGCALAIAQKRYVRAPSAPHTGRIVWRSSHCAYRSPGGFSYRRELLIAGTPSSNFNCHVFVTWEYFVIGEVHTVADSFSKLTNDGA